MGPVNGCSIRSTTLVEGLPAASSTVVAALLVRGPALLGLRAVLRRVRQGIEFAAALPEHLLDASSTMKKLFCVTEVVLSLAPVLRGGVTTRL